MQPRVLASAQVVQTGVAYAGFWRRLLAYLIDGALLGIVQMTVVLGTLLIVEPVMPNVSSPADFVVVILQFRRDLIDVAPVGGALAWAYFAILESSPMQATIGKMVLHLYVADLHGDPITFARASIRYWLKILSNLTLLIGWLMAAFTPRKQALHDLLAGTLVLRRVTYWVPAEIEQEVGEYWDGRRWIGSAPTMEGQ